MRILQILDVSRIWVFEDFIFSIACGSICHPNASYPGKVTLVSI